MQMSLMDVLITTVVSMGIVFIMLTILMFLMEGSSYIIRRFEQQALSVSVGEPAVQPVKEASDELARVALLVALTQASQEQSGKHYEVVSIEKKVS